MYHSKIILRTLVCSGFGFILAIQIGCSNSGSSLKMPHQVFRSPTVSPSYANSTPSPTNFPSYSAPGYSAQPPAPTRNSLQQQNTTGPNALVRQDATTQNFSTVGFRASPQPSKAGEKKFNPFGFAKAKTNC